MRLLRLKARSPFPYIMVETSMKLSVFTISTGQTDVKMKPRFFVSVLILNTVFTVIRRELFVKTYRDTVLFH